MRLAQAFQPCLADALGKPKEPCLHIRRKGGEFIGDRIVQDFDSPIHILLYLNFEIEGRGEKGLVDSVTAFRSECEKLLEDFRALNGRIWRQ